MTYEEIVKIVGAQGAKIDDDEDASPPVKAIPLNGEEIRS